MIDQFKKAKETRSVIHFKNFQSPEISWDDILKFVFEEASLTNKELEKRANPESNLWALGNIQIQDKLWLAPQTSNLFSKIKGVSSLLYKVNGNKENVNCNRYKVGICDCDLVWHTQGVRISLAGRLVSDHNDPHDILYWQLIGSSYWKINKDKTYKLEPGDLLYFSQEDSHEVWCEEPRAGIIIDGLGLLSK